VDRRATSGPPVPCPRRLVRRPRTGHHRALRDRAPSHLHVLAGYACMQPVGTHALAVGRCLPRAFRCRNGDSRAYGGRPAGVAFWPAILRIPEARPAIRAVCAIVACMIRRILSLSMAVLVAAGAFFGADLADQYRATADKLIDAALADTEGYNRL